MHEVSIFIESTWRGPARRDGVAMWLVECKRGDRLDTRQGFVHVKEGTETQGNLMAMINAFCILKKTMQSPGIYQVQPHFDLHAAGVAKGMAGERVDQCKGEASEEC